MSSPWNDFLSLDLPALLAGSAAALAASMAGSLLVLRRQSLFADGLAHAVLPGVLAAFLLTGSRGRGWLLLGGLAAGLLLAAATRFIARRSPLDAGTTLGALYPIFFAAGLLVLEQQSSGDLDLAPSHVLFGQLELLAWRAPAEPADWLKGSTYAALPGGLLQAGLLLVLNLLWLLVAGRALFVSGFDALGARLLGLRPGLIEPVSLALAAATAVAVFQIGGLVLALTLLLTPAASARLLTDRYRDQFLWAGALGLLSVWIGYAGAVFVVPWLLGCASLSASGGISLAAAGILAACAGLGPRRARR